LLELLADFSMVTILSLMFFAFIAGFLDAVVGGGGLIQLPALLINFPNTAIPTLFGTNKIAALSGTSIAAFQYAKRIRIDVSLLLITAVSSFIASFVGARIVSIINSDTLKPLILIILILIAIYTYFKKDLGALKTKELSKRKQMIYGSSLGLLIGFYDGFFGPGTGSFLVLSFVVVLGFEFVTASAYAKIINCFTNISALLVFISQGNYLLEIAILMAISNIIGNVIGANMALKRGNAFVRIIFLIIVSLMIIRYAYDVFYK